MKMDEGEGRKRPFKECYNDEAPVKKKSRDMDMDMDMEEGLKRSFKDCNNDEAPEKKKSRKR